MTIVRNSTDLMDARRVAVYGTLRAGGWNHKHYLSALLPVAELGTLFEVNDVGLYSLGSTLRAVPGAVIEEGKTTLVEVYDGSHLTDDRWLAIMQRVDRLEGHPHSYRRFEVIIDKHPCFMYLWNRGTDGLLPYPDGDWLAHQS